MPGAWEVTPSCIRLTPWHEASEWHLSVGRRVRKGLLQMGMREKIGQSRVEDQWCGGAAMGKMGNWDGRKMLDQDARSRCKMQDTSVASRSRVGSGCTQSARQLKHTRTLTKNTQPTVAHARAGAVRGDEHGRYFTVDETTDKSILLSFHLRSILPLSVP